MAFADYREEREALQSKPNPWGRNYKERPRKRYSQELYLSVPIPTKRTLTEALIGSSKERKVMIKDLMHWIKVTDNKIRLQVGKGPNKGSILVHNQFIISLGTNTWRRLNKGRVYPFKSPEQFIKKYC